MKKLYMLDTDTCSYIIRGTSDILNKRVKEHRHNLCIFAITLAELLFGVAKKESRRLADSVGLFQQLVEVKPWTPEAAESYAIIRNHLEKSGQPIGNMDMLIAASALAENAALITNNLSHFSRIPDLSIENWLE
jgi:tRNA(fMet)-specific endonuclease VapC